MDTHSIADQLVGFLTRRQFTAAVRALYARDVESRENAGPPTRGFDAVLADNERWVRENAIARFEVAGCYVDGDAIVLEMISDFTHTPTGRVIHSEEAGVYRVRDGKIVSTRFYYGY